MELNKPVFHRNKNAKNIITRKNARSIYNTNRNRSSFMFLFNLNKNMLKNFFSFIFALGVAIKKTMPKHKNN